MIIAYLVSCVIIGVLTGMGVKQKEPADFLLCVFVALLWPLFLTIMLFETVFHKGR